MKKTSIILGAITAILLMVSTSVAIPVNSEAAINKIDEIKQIQNLSSECNKLDFKQQLIDFINHQLSIIYKRWIESAIWIINIYRFKYEQLDDLADWCDEQLGFTKIAEGLRDFNSLLIETRFYIFLTVFSFLLDIRVLHWKILLKIFDPESEPETISFDLF